MRQLLASILLPVLLAGSVAASEVNLRVMSWNVHHGNGGVTALAQEMVNSGADVIGLQEVPDSKRALIESELERLHPTKKTWNASFGPAENGGTGNLVLTHYPLQSFSWTEIGPSSWGGNRTVSRAKIVVNGVPINVFSTHLDIGPGPDWGPGYRTENLTKLMNWCRSWTRRRALRGGLGFHLRFQVGAIPQGPR